MKSDKSPVGTRESAEESAVALHRHSRALVQAFHLAEKRLEGLWTLVLSVLEIRKKRENEKNHLWKRQLLMTTPPAALCVSC